MKKIGKTIAMILIMVMLASSFTSCFSVNALRGELGDNGIFLVLLIPVFPVLDLVTSPIQILYWIITKEPPWDFGSCEPNNQIFLDNAEYTVLSEYYSLKEKMSGLPETELVAITKTINSLPEKELYSLTDAVVSLSEEKKGALIRAYNSIPESEIIASMKRINALSAEEFISLVHTFYSMSDRELDSLIEDLKSLTETENVVWVDKIRRRQVT
jgi:hypothetical protein